MRFYEQQLLNSVWPTDPLSPRRDLFTRYRFPFLRRFRENQ
jgi:hypothetical protein